MNKLKLFLIFSFGGFFVFFIMLITVIGVGGVDTGVPIEPVATQTKAIEYAKMSSAMGAPWEIVLLTDAIRAEQGGLSGIEDVNPMYTTLEFLFMKVKVENYVCVGTSSDEDGNSFDSYAWRYTRTDTYTAKTQILSYIGLTDRGVKDLSPEKLKQLAQSKASQNSNRSVRYTVEFSANTNFNDVLKTYIQMDEVNTNYIVKLYESNYIKTWIPQETLDEINLIKAENGMYQFVDVNGSYSSVEGLTFTDGGIEVVYYNQLDPRWKSQPYGTDNIGGYACGPTSLSIVLSTLTDGNYDPVYMANWAHSNGYWAQGSGSYHSLIPGAAQAFNLPVSGCTISEPQRIINALSTGKLVVALMGPGHFTSSGHYIVLRGVTADGKILVADPASNNKSQQAWDLSIFLKEARKGAGAGGPFWIIG